jgi:hypothetical protein
MVCRADGSCGDYTTHSGYGVKWRAMTGYAM